MTDATIIPKTPTAPVATGSIPASVQPEERVAVHRRFSLWFGGVVLLTIAAAVVYVPEIYIQGTDDAYVQADTISVVPKIAGYVTALHVTDNSQFRAGQLLVEIDPRDFQVTFNSAQANLQSAQAAKVNATDQLAEQTHVIAAAAAAVDSDRATLQFAGQQLARYAKLAGMGAAPAERWQQAQSEIAEREAALRHDLAVLATAQAQVGVLQSQADEADAAIARQEASVAQARLNLSYTTIYATGDGSVANRTVQVGNFVQPGQTLFSAVPTDSYVIANFKETQLAHMRVGQHVIVYVDALGGRKIDARVDSFQRGTGSNFALLPPENATGNFVKVVQRIPVKVVLEGSVDALRDISPGMSVEARVTVRQPPWLLTPFLSVS